MSRTLQIVRKEWAEVFRNRFVLFTVAFLPLIITAIPLIMIGVIRSTGDLTEITAAELPDLFEPICEGLTDAECGQFFLLSQFLLLYMLLPMAIPITIASYSIIGEKTRRTLEPLLATPITTGELLSGKAVAAVVPAVGATWLGFGIFLVGVALLTESSALVGRLTEPLWLLAIFVVGPLLALAAVSVAVIVSSRATDPRAAEQLSMLVILPVLLIFFGQLAGLILINAEIVLYMAAALVVIDAGLLAFAVQLFQRETILTRWK